MTQQERIGSQIVVQVIPISSDREIGWGLAQVEKLSERLSELKEAVCAGVRVAAESLAGLPAVDGWMIDDVSTSFGISLATEAGVILTKASAGCTFEVSVRFVRE